MSSFVILGFSVYFVAFILFLMKKKLLASNVDAVSDLGLHCLPRTFYGFPDKSGLNMVAYLFILTLTQ